MDLSEKALSHRQPITLTGQTITPILDPNPSSSRTSSREAGILYTQNFEIREEPPKKNLLTISDASLR